MEQTPHSSSSTTCVWISHDAENCECCVDFWLGAQHLKDDSDNDSGYCSVTQTVTPDRKVVVCVPEIKVTPLTDDEVRMHNACVHMLYTLRIANLVPYNPSLDPSPSSTDPAAASQTQNAVNTRQRNFPQQTLYIPQETHTKRLKDTWENRSIWPFLFEAPYTTTPYYSPSSSSPPSSHTSIYSYSARASASSTSLDRYNARRKSWGEVHPAMMTTSGTKRNRGWSVDAHSRTRRVPTTTPSTVVGRGAVDKRRMSVDSFVSSTLTVDRASWSGSSRASSPVCSSSDESTRSTPRADAKSQTRVPVDALKNRTSVGDAVKNRTLSIDANGIPTWRSTSPYIYATPTSSRLDSNSSLSSVSTTNHHQDENNNPYGKRRLVRGGAVKRPYSMTSSTPLTTGSLPVLPTSKTFGTRMESTTSLASVASTASTHNHSLAKTTDIPETSHSTTLGPNVTAAQSAAASRGKQFKSLSTDHLVSSSNASNTSGGGAGEKAQGRRSGFGRLKNFVGGLYSTAPSSFRL